MLSEAKRRLALLEASAGTVVTLTLPHGKLYRIPSKRWHVACSDAAMGRHTPDADAVLAATACNESGSMLGLVHALTGRL